jgi:hypothetical protein
MTLVVSLVAVATRNLFLGENLNGMIKKEPKKTILLGGVAVKRMRRFSNDDFRGHKPKKNNFSYNQFLKEGTHVYFILVTEPKNPGSTDHHGVDIVITGSY